MLKSIRKKAGAKTTLVLLSILLFLFLISSIAFAGPGKLGDVNDDGEINVLDVVLVMRHILEIEELDQNQEKYADVNCDGKVNVQDVSLIMQYALGIIDEFPCELPVGFEVVGLSVINAKTIGVEFNNTPTTKEAEEASFKVTKIHTGAVIPVDATWDGKMAKLTRLKDLSFTPGLYLIEVTGIHKAFTGTVSVTEPTATSVEIRAESIPDATPKAPLRVKLLDQYGAEMTLHPGHFNWTAMNITTSVDVTGRISFDPVAKFTINTDHTAHEFSLGDKVQITFAHTPSGASKTVTLPVTYKVQLASLTFGDPILPHGATHLTRDMKNVRIPVTAIDQYGNPMFLVKGANVDLYSSDQLIIKNEDLSFVTVGGKQHVNIGEFQDKGSVKITIMGTPGIVASKSLHVIESVPHQLRIVTAPDASIVEGKSTTVRFDVLDQFGNRITSDREFYELRVVKASGGDDIIAEPQHDEPRLEISEAVENILIEAVDDAAPANETITFRLQKTDNTYIDSKTFSFNIISDLDDLVITVDKHQYTAGDMIEMTIKAMLNDAIHTDYNLSGLAKITLIVDSEELLYYRTLDFENGVAVVEPKIPATLAGEDYDVEVEFDSETYDAEDLFTVKTGPASKFVLKGDTGSPTLDVALTDAYNNPIKSFETNKLVNVTYPNQATAPAGISEEGDLTVNFVEGEGQIVFGADLVTGTYKVEHEEYSGTLTIK